MKSIRCSLFAVRCLPILLLVPLLGFVLGAGGAQLSEDEAIENAASAPKVSEYAERPEVEAVADYGAANDSWRVEFVEGSSDETVANAIVTDDTGEVLRATPGNGGSSASELSEEEATKIATANEKIREELSTHEGGYETEAEYSDGEWSVSFVVDGDNPNSSPIGGVPQSEGGKKVAIAEIDDSTWVASSVYTADQVGWNMARGERGAYGKQANFWYVWGPMALIFALAFLRNDKLLSLRNLDVAVMLSFLVSHGFFRQGAIEEAVLLWYPPLIYLLIRTLLLGFGVGERVEKTSNFPTWLLFALAALAGSFVLVLNTDARVIDVGYAGVAGGQLIMDGVLPYGNMPNDVGTGDTYGPLNYLLYVPFIWMFGFSGDWDFLPAAHALTSFSFVAGALAMTYAGWRFSGPKAAAALVFAWCIFPYTLYSTNNNTNDIIVASAAAVGIALSASPIARGAAIAAGFSIKLYPLLLGPLWLLHGGLRKRPATDFIIGGAAAITATFWVLLIGGSPVDNAILFFEKTLAFQGDRETPWTIFAQVPWLSFLQTPLTVLTILLAIVVAFVPRKRTIRRLAAFSAALVILFQLTVNYWFYPYVTWFEPFIFLSLLVATNEKTELDGDQPSAVSKKEARRVRAERRMSMKSETSRSKEEPILNIVGEKVALGPLRKDLAPLYQRWMNELASARSVGSHRPVTFEQEEDWYASAIKSETLIQFTVYERETSEPIGTTSLMDIDYRSRRAEFGILIGEKNLRNKGYGTETTKLILDYAFTAAGLHNVMLRVFSFNKAAIRAYEKAGFKEYGRRRESYLMNGRMWDDVHMDCISTEFESPVLMEAFSE